jgi:hypothetical protein
MYNGNQQEPATYTINLKKFKMKKILFAFATWLIAVAATTNQLYAQASDRASAEPATNFMAKLNTATIEKNNMRPAEVNTKALKNLKKVYKANGEQWAKATNGIVARFTSGGKNYAVYYDKKGRWVGSLKSYYENEMPGDLRKMVRQTYYDYKITYVQEVATNDDVPQPTYIVHIEADNDFKLIRIADGGMDVYQEYNKK